MSYAVTTMVVLSAYSAKQSADAQTASGKRQVANAERRYALQADVAENQMEEQQELALEKMTDITRQFLVAKGRSKVVQAEAGVTGVTAERMKRVMATKESEAKGKVAKEIDTNVINIAQGMIARKIDTEAMVAEGLAKQKDSLQIATDMVIAGSKGYMMGKSAQSSMVGAKSTSYTPSASTTNMSATRDSFASAFNTGRY